MLQEQLLEEIKQVPDDKLTELYQLAHDFRLGLLDETRARKETSARPGGLLQRRSLCAGWRNGAAF